MLYPQDPCVPSTTQYHSYFSDIISKLISNDSSISENTLVHFLVILNQQGYENLICKTFEDEGYFLYTSSHRYCAEIVFEYRLLKENIMNIYSLLPDSLIID